MDYATALQIAEYLAGLRAETYGYEVNRVQAGTPLQDFHQWANGKPLIAADHVRRGPDESLLTLLIDWRAQGQWYLIACSPTTRAPLAELWREEIDDSIHNLVWRYKPVKRDGRNEERLEYFRRHVGDLTMRLAVPETRDNSTRFVDDLFDVVDNRLRADELDPDEPETRSAFPEGQEYERRHLARERSTALIRLVKNRAAMRGALRCEVCNFDFEMTYGRIGKGYIEAHHTIPVSELAAHSATSPDDIALVCANCHRMLHRRRPWLRMHQLRNVLAFDSAV